MADETEKEAGEEPIIAVCHSVRNTRRMVALGNRTEWFGQKPGDPRM